MTQTKRPDLDEIETLNNLTLGVIKSIAPNMKAGLSEAIIELIAWIRHLEAEHELANLLAAADADALTIGNLNAHIVKLDAELAACKEGE